MSASLICPLVFLLLVSVVEHSLASMFDRDCRSSEVRHQHKEFSCLTQPTGNNGVEVIWLWYYLPLFFGILNLRQLIDLYQDTSAFCSSQCLSARRLLVSILKVALLLDRTRIWYGDHYFLSCLFHQQLFGVKFGSPDIRQEGIPQWRSAVWSHLRRAHCCPFQYCLDNPKLSAIFRVSPVSTPLRISLKKKLKNESCFSRDIALTHHRFTYSAVKRTLAIDTRVSSEQVWIGRKDHWVGHISFQLGSRGQHGLTLSIRPYFPLRGIDRRKCRVFATRTSHWMHAGVLFSWDKCSLKASE